MSSTTRSRFGLVAGSAAIGSTTGTTIGAKLRTRAPEMVIVVVLTILTVAAAAGAFVYGVVTVLAVALAAGLAQSLGKLSLDAIVQRDVPGGGPHLGLRPVRDAPAAVMGGRRRSGHRPAVERPARARARGASG